MKSNHNRWPPLKYPLVALAIFVLMTVPSVFAVCPTTPTKAEDLRYRIISDRWDPILHEHWVSLADCDHPGRPLLSRLRSSMSTKINPLPASRNDLNGSSEVSGQSPLVRAGENVRVLIREDTIRIEVRGVAEQNAGLGKPVRVRLAKVGIDFDQASKEIVGVVSGPATVEMQP